MTDQNITNVRITAIDPSSLGLFGLAIITLVASSSKLGFTSDVSLVIPWAIFLGASAQLFACIYDAKKGNVFGATAFGAYAFFWFAMAFSWMIERGVLGKNLSLLCDSSQFGFAFLGYLIFTLYMTIGASETNKALFIIFILIDFLFIGLTLSSFGIAYEFTHMLAGISELLISILAFYTSAALVLNQHFNKTFLPIGAPLGIFKK